MKKIDHVAVCGLTAQHQAGDKSSCGGDQHPTVVSLSERISLVAGLASFPGYAIYSLTNHAEKERLYHETTGMSGILRWDQDSDPSRRPHHTSRSACTAATAAVLFSRGQASEQAPTVKNVSLFE